MTAKPMPEMTALFEKILPDPRFPDVTVQDCLAFVWHWSKGQNELCSCEIRYRTNMNLVHSVTGVMPSEYLAALHARSQGSRWYMPRVLFNERQYLRDEHETGLVGCTKLERVIYCSRVGIAGGDMYQLMLETGLENRNIRFHQFATSVYYQALHLCEQMQAMLSLSDYCRVLTYSRLFCGHFAQNETVDGAIIYRTFEQLLSLCEAS